MHRCKTTNVFSLTIVVAAAALLLVGKPLPAGAQSCSQVNDRVFGADGRGGEALRFRTLQARVAEETRSGQTDLAARDRAALARLAASILSSKKTLEANGCRPRIVAQANASQGAASGPQGTTGTTAMRSEHGCVGFNGYWQSPTGVFGTNNGAGTLGNVWFSGTVNGNVYSGGWAAPQPGARGTFQFTLAPNGDSITGTLRNDLSGATGSWSAPCIGPMQTTPLGGSAGATTTGRRL